MSVLGLLRKNPFRKLSRKERREYLRKRDSEHNWVFPRVDRGREAFMNLAEFAKTLFPRSIVRQSAFKSITEIFLKQKKPLFLRDIMVAMKAKPRVSNTTLNDVWKCMLRSGLIFKKYRRDAAQLSTLFASRLSDMATYWETVVATRETRPKRRK